MSLITAADLAKSYGAQDVFESVTVTVPHQARIALIGPNGIGKTTLLRLLAGLEASDRGQIQRARGLRIGFLPQEARFDDGAGGEGTLWETCLESFRELRRQENELARLEAEMADPERAVSALARYGALQEAFELAGGYGYPARIQQVLHGLGFSDPEFGRPLTQLSGGERTRAFLARLLLEDPDLLILDEPTNHLDVQAVEWLEGWLKEWPGAAILVSHDRYFLDRTVDSVWELSRRGVVLYRGDYSTYAQQRAERLHAERVAYEAQQAHVAREQDYIRRNIAGQNTRQARGRRKRLERMLREERVDRPEAESSVRIEFGASKRSGDQVLVTRELFIGYRDSPGPLFRVPDLVLRRGECAAVLGPNGVGKTTLLRTLLGQVAAWSGEVRLGASLRVGYFEQAHEGLNPDRTVLEEILATAPRLGASKARDFLGRFLFSGDSVEKLVSMLSGGERGRLALAKLALEGANLLLLDEPTTHLDIPSQEILQEALAQFPGTILLVSHDRYLIDALATQVWAVSAEEREMAVYLGGYQAYQEEQERLLHLEKVPRAAQRRRRPASARPSKGKPSLEALENRIHELEIELSGLGKSIEHAGGDVELVRRLGIEYARLEAELQDRLVEWERMELGDDGA